MANNLPEVGARAVVENMPKFEAAMAAVNRALDTSGAKAEQAAKRSSVLDRAHDRMALAAVRASNLIGGAMGAVTTVVTGMATKIVAAIGTVVTALALALAAAIGIAIAGIGAFIGALAALSGRGANYEGIIDSFERLTASVQISSNALYDDLRVAAAGTVADMDLLRTTNLALAGAGGETGKVFGEALPRLLEIARAQARATGQDVTYLYESLITGIKRGSPLLIDNTGLMLKVGEANAAYAEELGITVEQMTAQDEQMALLNATLAAGEVALATYGDSAETLAVKLGRARASITNILDYLAIAMQPVAKAIMDSVNSVLTGVANFVRQAVPYLQAIGQLFVQAIQPFLDSIAGVTEQLNSPNAARSFFAGAVNTFGAFLRGVVLVGAQIIQAVADIANAIADFLIGQSPPPMGPLSQIDKGGANVMSAWLEGFVGGFSLDPVEKVVQQVADALGPVAAMALAQVEARLAQLDAALKPFQDRLSIIRAEFDAIAKVGEIAISRVQRQLETAVQALVNGEAGSGALVRQLDAQRQAIEDALGVQQQQTEEAQLQLALAEAMQARERALLAVRKSQIPALAAAATVTDKVKKDTEPAGKKPKEETGSGEAELPAVPGTPFEGAPLEDLFGIGSDPAAIKKAMAVIEDAWAEGFGDGGAGVLAGAQSSLQQGSDRLAKGFTTLGPRIQEQLDAAFGQLPQSVQKHLIAAGDHIKNFLTNTLPSFFNVDLSGSQAQLTESIGAAIFGAVAANRLVSILTGKGLASLIGSAITTAVAAGSLIINFAAALAPKIGLALFAAKYYFITGVAPVLSSIVSFVIAALGAVSLPILAGVALTIGAIAFAVVNYDFRAAIFNFLTEKAGLDPHAIGAVINVNPVIEALTNEDALFDSLHERVQNVVDAGGPMPIRVTPQIELQAHADEHGYEIREEVTAPKRLAEQIGKSIKERFPDELTKVLKGDTTVGSALSAEIMSQLSIVDFSGLLTALTTSIAGFVLAQSDAANPSTLIGFFTALPARLSEALSTFGPALTTTLLEPAAFVLDALVARFGQVFSPDPTAPGSLAFSVAQGMAYLATIPDQLAAALKPVGGIVVQTFVNPIINALNVVLSGFETMMRNLLTAIEQFSRGLGTGFSNLANTTGLVDAKVGAGLAAMAEQIARARSGMSIGRIPLAGIPGASQGGVFGPGSLRVHRGEELVTSAARRMTVFPARFVRAMEAVASVQPGASSFVHPSVVNTSSSTDNSRNYGDTIINGVQNGQDVMGRLAMMRAWR